MLQPREDLVQKLDMTKRPVPSINLKYVPARPPDVQPDGFKDLKTMKSSHGLLTMLDVDDQEDNIDPNEEDMGSKLELGGYGQPETQGPSQIPLEDLGVEVRKNKSVPNQDFIKGQVTFTTKNAVKDMMDQLPGLGSGTHGCILNEGCEPEGRVCIQHLGQGHFGAVSLYENQEGTERYVGKKVNKKKFNKNEITVPISLDHKNVTKAYGIIQRENQAEELELLLEYGGSSLHQFVKNEKKLTDDEIRCLSVQGLRGLYHLHLHGILHLDIKPENMCVQQQRDGSLLLKITDFGSAKLPYQPFDFTGWTPEYMAPETSKLYFQERKLLKFDYAITEENMTGKVDVFAFALVMMFMHTGYHILVKPITNGNTTYQDVPDDQLKTMKLNLILWLATNDTFVQQLIPDSVSLDMREILTEMTHHDFGRRIDAKQALELITSTAQGKIRLGLKHLEPRPGPSEVKPSRKWHGKGKNAVMFQRVHEKKGMSKRDACMAKKKQQSYHSQGKTGRDYEMTGQPPSFDQNMQMHQKPLTQDAIVTSKTAMLLQTDTGTENILGTEMLQDSDTTVDLQNQSPQSKVRSMIRGEAGWQSKQKGGTPPDPKPIVEQVLDEVDEDDEMTGNLPNLNML